MDCPVLWTEWNVFQIIFYLDKQSVIYEIYLLTVYDVDFNVLSDAPFF